jgi:hypothetical protein
MENTLPIFTTNINSTSIVVSVKIGIQTFHGI